MILHQPEISIQEGEVCVSARVECQKPVANIPETLWFRYPEKYQAFTTDRGDSFAVGLLQSAMGLGEDLDIRGALSPKLLYGLREYHKVYCAWFPQVLQPIQIRCESLEIFGPGGQGSAVMSAFSGGVDSFYTLWSHLPQNQPLEDYQITHCLFVQGFDISLRDQGEYALYQERFGDLCERLNVALIPCRTNLQAFVAGRVKWNYTFGAGLAASALALTPMVRRFYLPSGHQYELFIPDGSTPIADHWLSTETVEMIHDGAGAKRIEKLSALSTWSLARENLRVCTNPAERRLGKNCSCCEKCLRTRTMLDILGLLPQFPSFKGKFSQWDILLWVVKSSTDTLWVTQIIAYAFKNRLFRYLPALFLVLFSMRIKKVVIRLMPFSLFKQLKLRILPPEKNIFSHDYVKEHAVDEE